MIEFQSLALAGAAGALLGALFFGGLWWTVRQGVSSQWPALWFLGSMLLRMSITLTGFYFIGRENWQRWLLCLCGFVMARFVIQRLTRSPDKHAGSREAEPSYAP